MIANPRVAFLAMLALGLPAGGPAMAQPPAASAAPWLALPPTPDLPPGGQEGYAAVNGVRLWYAQYGVENAGTPVLLLHGGLSSSNYFGLLIPALVANGYRVIAIDSRGQGRSTRSAAPFSYHLMASDVLGVLDQLKVARVDLVGWSDGAIIGLDLAMTRPDRLSRLFAFGVNADASALIPGFDTKPAFAAYLKRDAEDYRRWSPTPDQFDALLAQIGAMWASEPRYTRADLAKIAIPVTIADGQYEEAIKPEHDTYMAAAIPNANLVILPNVSHFAMVQNPAEFNDAVAAFLRYR